VVKKKRKYRGGRPSRFKDADPRARTGKNLYSCERVIESNKKKRMRQERYQKREEHLR